jgi:hypothetical protein
MTTETRTPDEKNNEWLQFIEFIKRKYGYNSSEYIRINDYNNRSNNSVAEYYNSKTSALNITTDIPLKDLLKNEDFKEMLQLDRDGEISKFTEIYNHTDYLMRSLNTIDDNLYIQCNPVKVDNSGVIEETTNSNSASTVASIITEGADFFSPEKLFRNVGLQVFLGVVLFAVILFVGNFLFTIGTRLENKYNIKSRFKRAFNKQVTSPSS